MSFRSMCLAAALIVACGGSGSPPGDGDARDVDGAAGDTGTDPDGGPPQDGGGPDGGTVTTGQWVLGYYVSYQRDQYPIADIDWTALTHIAFSPLSVGGGPGYAFDLTFSGAFGSATEGRTFARDLATAARAHGVTPLLMLGGAGLSDNVRPAIDADLAGFVTRTLALLDELGYAGVDLDVEASNFATADFIRLAAALRAARPSIVLTLPGGGVEVGTDPDPRIAELAGYLDRYFIQSYFGGSHGLFTGPDFRGMLFESWFGAALDGETDLRPFSIEYSLRRLNQAGIPKAKLGMGVAFYADCYLAATTPPGGQPVTGPRQPAYAASSYCWGCNIGGGDNAYPLSRLFAAGGRWAQASTAERHFDAEAASSYLSLGTAANDAACGGSTRFIGFEDEQSLVAKGTWSRANGYGGVIIWTIQQGWLPANAAGGRARNALMAALRQGFLL